MKPPKAFEMLYVTKLLALAKPSIHVATTYELPKTARPDRQSDSDEGPHLIREGGLARDT